jgi:Cu-Zn family superoxide dismutase
MKNKSMIRISLISIICAVTLASVAHAAPGDKATAEIKDRDGKELGTVTLTETAHGVLLTGELTSLTLGPHGFHMHAVGKCEPPFTSAGGHFNPENRKHGYHDVSGSHAGDMPSLHAFAEGRAIAHVMAASLTLSGGAMSVLDQDGAAVVINAKADDYKTDPAGDSGERIACGVVTRVQ